MPRGPIDPDPSLSRSNRWVVEAMNYAGITQSELARLLEQAGVLPNGDRSKINKITKGSRDVSLSEALAISAVTKYPPLMPEGEPLLAELVNLYFALDDAHLRKEFLDFVRQQVSDQSRALPTDAQGPAGE